jgi:hypothetical protein
MLAAGGTLNMKRQYLSGLAGMLAALVLVMFTLSICAPMAMAADDGQKTSSNPPPFDFTDQYYRDNGIEPTRLLQRVGTSTNNSLNWTTCQAGDPTPCPNTDPNRNQTRVLQTTGGFAFDGSLLYYSIMAFIVPDSFTNDSAGQDALKISNERQAFIFPIRHADGTYILSPALSNRRQDNIFDTSGDYLGNDPLGLWLLEFVELTDFGISPAGQQILAPYAQKNGIGTDGTPVVETLDDLNELVKQGVLKLVTRNLDGSQGFPWVV